MEKSKKLHYAWLVMIALIAMQGGFVGIHINCNGILFSAIIKDMGYRAGDMSLYYTIRAFSQAFAVGFTSKLFFSGKIKPKMFVVTMAAFASAPYLLMPMFNWLWQFYIVAVLAGIGFSSVLVIIPVIISNWFKKSAGTAMGLSMAASGVAGAVFGPVVSGFVNANGWRFAAFMIGAVALVLIVVPVMLFLYVSPEEKGMTPYGYEETAETVRTGSAPAAKDYQMPPSIFALAIVAIICGLIMSQFMNQIPTFAASIGYTLTVGATISSISMIGNVGGKLLMGSLTDKLGIFKACSIGLVVICTSMVLFIVGANNIAIIYCASLLFGLVYSFGTTVPPLVLLEVYGPDKYKNFLSKFQAINGIVMAFASSIFGYIYDFTGAYTLDFVFGIVVLTISFVTYNMLNKVTKRIKAEQDAI